MYRKPEYVVSLMSSRHLNAGCIIDPSCGAVDGSLGQTRCINQLDAHLGTQFLQCHDKISRMLSTEAFHGRDSFTQCLLRKLADFRFCCLHFSLTQPCGYSVRLFGVIEGYTECHFQLLVQVVVFLCPFRADLKEREQCLDFLLNRLYHRNPAKFHHFFAKGNEHAHSYARAGCSSLF